MLKICRWTQHSPCRGSFDEKDHVIKVVITAVTALPTVAQYSKCHTTIYLSFFLRKSESFALNRELNQLI